MGDAVVNKSFLFYGKESPTPEIKRLLHSSEELQFCVKTFRDVAAFTDKRILIVDRQGITGKKIEYFSVPYRSIVTYALETAGTLDLDAEIKLVLSGGIVLELNFFKDKENQMEELLFQVYDLITQYVLG
ncbi:MAG: PH domain-containing protein [Clostridium sp.]|uniref:PH domain-containing protein n=1 Tax=Clostridium sp. TaxID=1506 RepID=UPI002911E59D|nr:PH domain-containing protein [Clostridium sp.]MDU7338087.1 PH domain-containing protein [Clostridium sp.]